jgi:anti-anti-sigma regulatory factor/DNA-directed RNA polymerase subunit RPC12/RpoP
VSAPLSWTVVHEAEGPKISLSGPIDEWADFDALLADVPAGPLLIVNLAGVDRISSVGVRVWIQFLDKLKLQDMQVMLDGCSVVIVRQLSMISRFRGHGTVRSVYAPYYCSLCKTEQLRLVNLGLEVAPQLQMPVTCPTCGSSLELDEDEALYTELQT